MRQIVFASFALLLLHACGGASSSVRIGARPAGATFHGVWQSPQYGRMELCETGSAIIGTYEKDERRGRIQGTTNGDVLQFQWEETRELVVGRAQTTRGRGYFRISQGQDEDWFIEGEWGVDSEIRGGGPWSAVKMRRGNPESCSAAAPTSGSDTSTGSSYDQSSTPAPMSNEDAELEADLEGL